MFYGERAQKYIIFGMNFWNFRLSMGSNVYDAQYKRVMEEKTMKTYEEEETVMQYLGRAYRRCRRRMDISQCLGEKAENSRTYDSDRNYVYLIDRTVMDCCSDTRHIIINDYLKKSAPKWYVGYFSNSRYYRVRRDAVHEFLHCLQG